MKITITTAAAEAIVETTDRSEIARAVEAAQQLYERALETDADAEYEQDEEQEDEQPVCLHPTFYDSGPRKGQCTKCGEFDLNAAFSDMRFYGVVDEPLPEPDMVDIPDDVSSLTVIRIPARHKPVADFLKADPEQNWYTRVGITKGIEWPEKRRDGSEYSLWYRMERVSVSLAYLKQHGIVQNGSPGHWLNTHDWGLTERGQNCQLVVAEDREMA